LSCIFKENKTERDTIMCRQTPWNVKLIPLGRRIFHWSDVQFVNKKEFPLQDYRMIMELPRVSKMGV